VPSFSSNNIASISTCPYCGSRPEVLSDYIHTNSKLQLHLCNCCDSVFFEVEDEEMFELLYHCPMLSFIIKPFSELSVQELYELLKLRSKVFVVEQNCVFQDMDDKDQKGLHLLGYAEGELVAYSRLLPPGVSYTEMSIGRVVTDTNRRREGFGVELMKESIKRIAEAYGPGPLRIGAQCYLQRFYEGFGFVVSSEEYLEDGIPHVEMLIAD
jgi:ElaA protein